MLIKNSINFGNTLCLLVDATCSLIPQHNKSGKRAAAVFVYKPNKTAILTMSSTKAVTVTCFRPARCLCGFELLIQQLLLVPLLSAIFKSDTPTATRRRNHHCCCFVDSFLMNSHSLCYPVRLIHRFLSQPYSGMHLVVCQLNAQFFSPHWPLLGLRGSHGGRFNSQSFLQLKKKQKIN